MNGVVTIASGVLAVVRTFDSREFWPGVGSFDGRKLRWSPRLPTHMVIIPFMGLQIMTHIHTRRIKDLRGRKNRGKSQGTLH